MNLTGIESLGYSRFDWELAKRKEKDPDVKFEDILKEEMERLDRRPVMYESPIEKIYGEMQSQLIKQDEMNMMLSVNQAVGYEVDKDELLKALAYDREQYQKGYNDAMQKMRWIPVTERLPEDGEIVLCTNSSDDLFEAYAWDDCGEIKWSANGCFDVPVVAWMERPEPYKEDEE